MTPIDVVVSAELAVVSPPEKTRERILNAFSVLNPKRSMLERLNLDPSREAEEIFVAVEHPDDTVRVPRGARDRLVEQIRKDGIEPRWIDRRTDGSPIAAIVVPVRDYQDEGVSALLRNTQGLCVLPCACGKTRLGVAAIGRVARSTIVIAPSNDLVGQWVETMTELLHGAMRVGVLADGEFPDGIEDVVVATPDSIEVSLASPSFLAWLRGFGLVIMDESHRVGAPSIRRIMNAIPAKFRLGLTATPQRNDGLERVVDWVFGPRLVEKTVREMVARGVIMPAEIESVETGWAWTWAPDARRLAKGEEIPTGDDDVHRAKRMRSLDAALAEDAERTATIAARAIREARAGESVLVLANRKAMCADLAKAIAAGGVACEAVTSAKKGKKRKNAVDRFRDGEFPVLIATQLADEGLDIPRLSRVILAFPHSGRSGVIQRLGRLLRFFPGKKPKLIDFVDGKVPMLKRRSYQRRRVYRECGFID